MGGETGVSAENVPHTMKPNLDGEIRDGGHHMLVRVYYEDTDFLGMSSTMTRDALSKQVVSLGR